jgi:putative transposase
MPRKPRSQSATGTYHFIARGVNKKDLFHKKNDYDYYLALIAEYKVSLKIEIYHYCLMTNHTHFLLKTDELNSLSSFGHLFKGDMRIITVNPINGRDRCFRIDTRVWL